MSDTPLTDREFVEWCNTRTAHVLNYYETARLYELADANPHAPRYVDDEADLIKFATLRLDLADANKRIAELTDQNRQLDLNLSHVERERDEAREANKLCGVIFDDICRAHKMFSAKAVGRPTPEAKPDPATSQPE